MVKKPLGDSEAFHIRGLVVWDLTKHPFQSKVIAHAPLITDIETMLLKLLQIQGATHTIPTY